MKKHTNHLRATDKLNTGTEFLTTLSHDLRVPMNAIMGFTALALEHKDDSAWVTDCLCKIRQSLNDLLPLIDSAIEMNHIEAGEIHPDEKPENLCDLLWELREMIEPETSAKQLELMIDTSCISNENIVCDRSHLKQVLFHLLTNAVQYTPSGGKIGLFVCQFPSAVAGNAIYKFHVFDTGIGMSEEFSRHAFEPFAREQNSTVNNVHGAGLGLSIAKGLVTMMGGKITVKSEYGTGSEFVVTVDFQLQREFQTKPALSSEAAPKSLDQVRILFVGENRHNLELAEEILTDAGYLVETSQNGADASDKVQHSAPGYYHLVLMDIQMPRVERYEAARAIRALPDPRLAEMPIIALTANALEADRQYAFKYGIDAHVEKPINLSRLFSAIRNVLYSDDQLISA
jgi:CheY-like chemotaxis protein